MSLLYEAENLKKRYGGELALDIPHFSLEQGASLALVGANGSGKSTFLRILAFLEEPSEGRLRYFGGARPRRECTLLLQEPWLLRASVRANVLLGLRLHGRRMGGDCGVPLDEAYRQAMLAVGFEEPDRHAKRRPGALSGGERQRVALAARLVLAPRVLLLDEPTAHVDAASARCIIRALRDAHAKGAAVVCATHDDDLAAALEAPVMKMRKPG